MSEPDSLVLKLLREMRGEMGETRAAIDDVHTELGEVREHMATKADVGNVRLDLEASEKRLGERINHLNRAVVEYHSSAVGHGLLFSEID